MIAQGLAPSFWGAISDVTGRRVVFIGTFIVYMIANVALAVSQNYGELMAFRALQAVGSSATISIGMAHLIPLLQPLTGLLGAGVILVHPTPACLVPALQKETGGRHCS